MGKLIGRGKYASETYPEPRGTGGSGGGDVTDWAFYTALFTVGNGTGATLGDGTITGRYRIVGDTCEVENFLVWAANSSFGNAPVPTLLITIPPGLTPDPATMLQSFPGFGIAGCSITGIIGGVVSEGVDFFVSVGDFGPPIGLVVALGIPAGLSGIVQDGDQIFMTTSFSVL